MQSAKLCSSCQGVSMGVGENLYKNTDHNHYFKIHTSFQEAGELVK